MAKVRAKHREARCRSAGLTEVPYGDEQMMYVGDGMVVERCQCPRGGWVRWRIGAIMRPEDVPAFATLNRSGLCGDRPHHDEPWEAARDGNS